MNSDISKTSTDASHKVVPGDYDILKSPSGYRLINAGLALLKLKFHSVLDLEDVVRAQTGSFSASNGDFIQI